MKGRSPSAEQKRFHDLLAREIGCVACRTEGILSTYVSIHHCDGRTKPHAHWFVLPLCGPHHQDQGIAGVVAIHPHKTRFQERYGTQKTLLAWCIEILQDRGFVVPDGALCAAGMLGAPA
ncbi:Ref family recombination enhancement nuclease [Bordetella genomosp. 9]|uniref:Recombinase n=1 Tax=Bordetella genomosp. 9 TaxID=1416803 RepID=A0A1W6YYV6_9BORD|nr:Ref family recombination enhancement nuclease [Bordetella genomosp. 9]ARP86282.1 recombinase [Bordetella genomosp. 9]